MPSFTGKTFSSYYKNLLGIDQSSNAGITTSVKRIQDGAGNDTAIFLSDDNLAIRPVNDDTAATFQIRQTSGNNVLAVDTTNSVVKVGVKLLLIRSMPSLISIVFFQQVFLLILIMLFHFLAILDLLSFMQWDHPQHHHLMIKTQHPL